jgi:APA family basic amino acid/polyamine antiporter
MSLGELRRILGTVTGVAVCCGMAVGAGILRTPGTIAANLPDASWIFGVWCLGALVATLDAFILAEMAAMEPRVGGLVAYVRLSFGPRLAFLVGWSMLLVTWPASLAIVAVAAGELIAGGASTLVVDPSESSTGAGRAVAAAIIAGIGGLNLIGLRFGARFEIALVGAKMLLLAGVCAAAVFAGGDGSALVEAPAMPQGAKLLGALGAAMAMVVFSYDGYADAVYLAGETKDPGRALPRALLLALVSITGLYLLANAAFVHVLGVGGLAKSAFPALDVATHAFGDAAGRVLTAVALVVLGSAVSGYFLTGPRIARLLAEERLAPVGLGRVGASGAPVWGTLWIVAVAIAFALTNTFGRLVAITVPFMSATTALVAIGLLVQRARAPERPRPFRVRGAAIVVGLQVLLGAALLASFVISDPVVVGYDAAAIAVGLLVYAWLARRRAASAQ